MPTCTRAALAETNPDFGFVGLNRKQYEAAMIYLMVLELEAIGGPDYRNTMNTTLIEDAVALTKTMNQDQRRIAMLNIAKSNALAAGASSSAVSSVDKINKATSCCFQSYSDLESILILLTCLLGEHAPQ